MTISADSPDRIPPVSDRDVMLTEGPDSPVYVDGAAVTYALGGDDVLPVSSSTVHAYVLAGEGADRITGFAQMSVLEGQAGNDTIEGGILSNIYGGDGDDLIDWKFESWSWYSFDSEFGPYVLEACIAGEAGNDTIRISNFDQLVYDDGLVIIDTGIDGGSGTDRLETTLISTEIRVAILEHGFEINGVAVTNIEEFVFDDATLDSAQMAALADAQATTGTEGDDILIGTTASELLNGLAGNDWIVPGGGADTVLGGPGTDMMSFADRLDGAVNVRLQEVYFGGYYSRLYPAQTKVPDATLDVSGIENVTGTNFDDVLWGSDGDNYLRGLYGDDTFQGLGGTRDVLDGGGGNDTASYEQAANNASDPGVTVSLLAGTGRRRAMC